MPGTSYFSLGSRGVEEVLGVLEDLIPVKKVHMLARYLLL